MRQHDKMIEDASRFCEVAGLYFVAVTGDGWIDTRQAMAIAPRIWRPALAVIDDLVRQAEGHREELHAEIEARMIAEAAMKRQAERHIRVEAAMKRQAERHIRVEAAMKRQAERHIRVEAAMKRQAERHIRVEAAMKPLPTHEALINDEALINAAIALGATIYRPDTGSTVICMPMETGLEG